MNAVGQISNKNIVISEFFSTSYLACAMPDLSMLRHAFDFIEKDSKIPIQTNYFSFDNSISRIFLLGPVHKNLGQ